MQILTPHLLLPQKEKTRELIMKFGIQYREASGDPKLGPSFPCPFSHLLSANPSLTGIPQRSCVAIDMTQTTEADMFLFCLEMIEGSGIMVQGGQGIHLHLLTTAEAVCLTCRSQKGLLECASQSAD